MIKKLAALAAILLGIAIIFLALASRHAKVTNQAFLTIENLIGTMPLFFAAAVLFVFVTIGVVFSGRKHLTSEGQKNSPSSRDGDI